MKTLRWLRNSFFVYLIFALIVIAIAYPRLTIENDILALFPDAKTSPAVKHADQLLAEKVTHKLLFLVTAKEWSELKASLPELAKTLNEAAAIESVRYQFEPSNEQAWKALAATQTANFLTLNDQALLTSQAPEALAALAYRNLLTNPGEPIAETLVKDPFHTLSHFLSSPRQLSDKILIDSSGVVAFVEGTRRYAMLVAELRDSPYSVAVQQQIKPRLEKLTQQVSALEEGEVISTGAFFYAAKGTQQARKEISTVGLGSVIGIVLLFTLVFRSLKLLVLTFLPIALGVAMAIAVCQLLFGRVHIISLIFGASLVGVAIDYALHFFTRRHAMYQTWQPAKDLTALVPALLLGLLSSVTAYLAFTFTGFPGFTQIAVFSVVGLISACWMVLGLYPTLLKAPAKYPLPSRLLVGVERYRHGVTRLFKSNWLLMALGLLAAMAIAVIVQIKPLDDLRAMQLPDQEQLAQDKRIAALTGAQMSLQYLLVEGESPSVLLENMASLEPGLMRLQQQGDFSRAQLLTHFLPAPSAQLANYQLFQRALVDGGALFDLLATFGVMPNSVMEIMENFSQDFVPITLADAWPLLSQLPDAPTYFEMDGKHYSPIFFNGIKNTENIRKLAEENSLTFVDIVADTSALLMLYRIGTVSLLLMAYVAIGLLLAVRHKLLGALAVILPPLLASIFTLAVLSLLGFQVSVFNFMALLLVLGLGVDASLFLRESGGTHSDTWLAILLSSLTTLLSFGLLALSSTAAIASFGFTLALGIIFSFLLAPLCIRFRSTAKR